MRHSAVIEVRQTEAFKSWLVELRDIRARAIIIRRLDAAGLGNLGDVGSVGDGVSEMRIHHGPGYRVYFARRGQALIVLLCGGDKSSQTRDIRRAQKMAQALSEEP